MNLIPCDHNFHFRGLENLEGTIKERWQCVICGSIEHRPYDDVQDREWC